MLIDSNARILDYRLKQRRLVVPFSVTGHATPASKVHSTDNPASVILSSEGKTAEAAAADSGCNFTTEVDASGIFGILVKDLGTVRKILSVEVKDTANSPTSTAIDVDRKGASSTGITASGNVAVSVTGTGLDLSAEDFAGVLILDYMVEL